MAPCLFEKSRWNECFCIPLLTENHRGMIITGSAGIKFCAYFNIILMINGLKRCECLAFAPSFQELGSRKSSIGQETVSEGVEWNDLHKKEFKLRPGQ